MWPLTLARFANCEVVSISWTVRGELDKGEQMNESSKPPRHQRVSIKMDPRHSNPKPLPKRSRAVRVKELGGGLSSLEEHALARIRNPGGYAHRIM